MDFAKAPRLLRGVLAFAVSDAPCAGADCGDASCTEIAPGLGDLKPPCKFLEAR